MSGRDEQDFQRRIQRIETLVQQIDQIPDGNLRAGAEELVQALLSLHGAGLERIVEFLDTSGAAGEHIMERMTGDDLVNSLLLLHGLHPLDFETRVRKALDTVRPYMESHRGNVELLAAEDGIVRLRLQGSCHGCPSSAITLKLAIEEALYAAAPDLVDLQVEGVVDVPARPANNVIPLTELRPDTGNGSTNAHGWMPVEGMTGMTPETIRTLVVGGQSLVFSRVGETYYAYANHCPHCGQTLDDARLEALAIACPSCGHHYDVQRAGRSLEQPNEHLEPFPLLLDRGQLKVALPALPALQR